MNYFSSAASRECTKLYGTTELNGNNYYVSAVQFLFRCQFNDICFVFICTFSTFLSVFISFMDLDVIGCYNSTLCTPAMHDITQL